MFFPVHLQTDAEHFWLMTFDLQIMRGAHFSTFSLTISQYFAFGCAAARRIYSSTFLLLLLFLFPLSQQLNQLNPPEAQKPSESVSLAGRSCCHSAASGPLGRAKPISQRPLEEEDERSPQFSVSPSTPFFRSPNVDGGRSGLISRQQRCRRIPACLSCLEEE